MKNPEDVMIRNLLEEESQEQLFQHRDNLRREAKQNILKIQENRRTYNRKRKEAHLYKKVTKVKPHDRYDVAKIGDHEGAQCYVSISRPDEAMDLALMRKGGINLFQMFV
ncbi:hypothetical protein TNCV_897921 [Trichonephila clavipes]|nr:hypothetical protein TNCV_897921 [Trichonephila clavipes]